MRACVRAEDGKKGRGVDLDGLDTDAMSGDCDVRDRLSTVAKYGKIFVG